MRGKGFFTVGLLLLVLVFFGSFAMVIQPFSLSGGKPVVWSPEYTSFSCTDLGTDVTLGVRTLDSDGESFKCPWGNFYAAAGCEFTVDKSALGFLIAKECDYNGGNCVVTDADVLGNKIVFNVPYDKSLFLDENAFGSVSVSGRADKYGLDVIQSDGLRFSTGDCTYRSLTTALNSRVDVYGRVEGSDVIEYGLDSKIPVGLEFTQNVVTGVSRKISSKVVMLNGEWVYVTTAGHYNKIFQTDEGDYFVDSRQEFTSSEIECIPLVGACDADGKISSLIDKPCDELLGNSVGGVVVSDQLCSQRCVNDKVDYFNCVSLESTKCSDADKPYWDNANQRCIGSDQFLDDVEGKPIWPWFVLGSLFILSLLLMKFGSPKRGKKR